MTDLIYLRAQTEHLRVLRNGDVAVRVVALVGDRVLRAVNSDAPELVPRATLFSNLHEWPGKPVTFGHPTVGGKQLSAATPGLLVGYGIGTIDRADVVNDQLVMDIRLDPTKAERLGAGSVLARLRNGEHCDVSVGAFVTTDATPGSANGKHYARRWASLRPDHLAFVARGACSMADGCFARAAECAADYVPLDAYAPALAQLRAAEATPESTFAERYKDERRRELVEEYAQWDEEPPEPHAPPSGDLTAYQPPDPYKRDLDKMKEKP